MGLMTLSIQLPVLKSDNSEVQDAGNTITRGLDDEDDCKLSVDWHSDLDLEVCNSHWSIVVQITW